MIELSEATGTARIAPWCGRDGGFLEDEVYDFPLASVPLTHRHRGALLWYVDAPGGFSEWHPRADGEADDAFERRWRAARTRWWQFWRWPIWGVRIPWLP